MDIISKNYSKEKEGIVLKDKLNLLIEKIKPDSEKIYRKIFTLLGGKMYDKKLDIIEPVSLKETYNEIVFKLKENVKIGIIDIRSKYNEIIKKAKIGFEINSNIDIANKDKNNFDINNLEEGRYGPLKKEVISSKGKNISKDNVYIDVYKKGDDFNVRISYSFIENGNEREFSYGYIYNDEGNKVGTTGIRNIILRENIDQEIALLIA